MADKELTTLVQEQAEQIKALMEVVKEQGAQLEAIQKSSPPAQSPVEVLETPKETFTVNKVKYRFTVPKYIKPFEGVILSRDALKDPAELERLVTIRSSVVAKSD